jgi:hypothetical protein
MRGNYIMAYVEPIESLMIKKQVKKELKELLLHDGMPADKVQIAIDIFDKCSKGYVFQNKKN